MKTLSKYCGLAVSAGALAAAVVVGVQTGGLRVDVQASPDAPAHSGPVPPVSSSTLTSTSSGYVPGNPDPNPGADGGGGGGGGGG